MARTRAKVSRTPVSPPMQGAAALSPAAFKARVEALVKDADVLEEPLAADTFESLEDAEDLVKHVKFAFVEQPRHRDIAGTRRRAKARRTSVTRQSTAKAHEAARKPTTRDQRTAPAAKRVPPTGTASGGSASPTRAALTLAQLVRPGVSLGPPMRRIGARFIVPEIDIAEAKFRRQRVGIGKCTGDKLKAVRRAFAFAFVMLESAKAEVRAIKANPADARVLWHASMAHEEAALSYWFGENYSRQQTITMLFKIDEMLTEWSLAFCGGFRDILPVFIRCKSVNGVGGGPARHIVKNTIELFPRYFDMPPAKQAITMLHEMGHRCKSLLKPRDESHPLCSGGWKRKKTMCYRDIGDVNEPEQPFRGGNPRILAAAATDGSGSAKKALLNNIDNYVCYMWNRYADHGERTLFLLSEGAKQAKPTASGRAKPDG